MFLGKIMQSISSLNSAFQKMVIKNTGNVEAQNSQFANADSLNLQTGGKQLLEGVVPEIVDPYYKKIFISRSNKKTYKHLRTLYNKKGGFDVYIEEPQSKNEMIFTDQQIMERFDVDDEKTESVKSRQLQGLQVETKNHEEVPFVPKNDNNYDVEEILVDDMGNRILTPPKRSNKVEQKEETYIPSKKLVGSPIHAILAKTKKKQYEINLEIEIPNLEFIENLIENVDDETLIDDIIDFISNKIDYKSSVKRYIYKKFKINNTENKNEDFDITDKN